MGSEREQRCQPSGEEGKSHLWIPSACSLAREIEMLRHSLQRGGEALPALRKTKDGVPKVLQPRKERKNLCLQVLPTRESRISNSAGCICEAFSWNDGLPGDPNLNKNAPLIPLKLLAKSLSGKGSVPTSSTPLLVTSVDAGQQGQLDPASTLFRREMLPAWRRIWERLDSNQWVKEVL